MFESFELFGKPIGTYGVMALLGIVACWLVGIRLIKQRNINIYDFAIAMVLVYAGMAVGASLLYGVTRVRLLYGIIVNLDKLSFFEVIQALAAAFSGMVFYGGFLGGCLALHLYSKHSKTLRYQRSELFDIYAVLTPLFHAFGRVGCFLGGCCYGIESEFGFTTHTNTNIPSINGVNRFPVQLLESGCNLIIFFILLTLFRKWIMEKRLIWIYLVIYPVVRFCDEFLRGDVYRGFLLGLSTSQWVSIILFGVAVVVLVRKGKRET